MKRHEAIRLLNKAGFTLERSSKHLIYKKDEKIVIVRQGGGVESLAFIIITILKK